MTFTPFSTTEEMYFSPELFLVLMAINAVSEIE